MGVDGGDGIFARDFGSWRGDGETDQNEERENAGEIGDPKGCGALEGRLEVMLTGGDVEAEETAGRVGPGGSRLIVDADVPAGEIGERHLDGGGDGGVYGAGPLGRSGSLGV